MGRLSAACSLIQKYVERRAMWRRFPAACSFENQSAIAPRYTVKNRAQNAANFFRKITILSIVSTMNTGRFVKRVVHFYDFD